MPLEQFNGLTSPWFLAMRNLIDPRFIGGLVEHPGMSSYIRNAFGIATPQYPPILSHPQAYRLFGPELLGMLGQETMMTYPPANPSTPTFWGIPITHVDVRLRPFMSPSFNQYLPQGGTIPGQPGSFGGAYPQQPRMIGGGYPMQPGMLGGDYPIGNHMGFQVSGPYNVSGIVDYLDPSQSPPGIPFGDNDPGGYPYVPVQTYPPNPQGPFFHLFL